MFGCADELNTKERSTNRNKRKKYPRYHRDVK